MRTSAASQRFRYRLGALSRRLPGAQITFLTLTLSGCAHLYVAEVSAPAAAEPAATAIYFLGDFGTPSRGFRAVAQSIADDIAEDDSRERIESPPLMVELGDNMYVRGLPRPELDSERERGRLRKMARALARCRFRGEAVPLVLVPGNHDYDERAFGRERSYGDITRWYFLDDFGIEELENWECAPGRIGPEDRTAADLYDRIYESPGALVDFMSPHLIDGTGPEIGLVAIDSELLITLFDEDQDALAELYLERLRRTLRRVPEGSVRAVVAHHPLETYGNRPAQLGRFLLGPGWPQFPEWWHKALVLPPFAQLVTLGRWLAHSRQDIHSGPVEEYRRRVHDILVEEGARLFFAGHDHDAQLIDLRAAMGGEGEVFQVLTGNAAKANHPVTRGNGTLFYYLGYGYARVVVFRDRLLIEMKDSDGRVLFRYAVDREASSGRQGAARRIQAVDDHRVGDSTPGVPMHAGVESPALVAV